MKKKFLTVALPLAFGASMLAAPFASAQMHGGFHHNEVHMNGPHHNMMGQGGGFQGPNATQTATVSQLKNLPDDSRAIIEGRIVRQIKGDHYEFQDATGSVEIEVDDKYWAGQTVTPNNVVRLLIEIDHDMLSSEYEVEAPVVILK